MSKKENGTEEVHLRFFTTPDKEDLAAVRAYAKKLNPKRPNTNEVIRDAIHLYVKQVIR